jgi:lipocalin
LNYSSLNHLVQGNFDFKRYLGLWHEQQRYEADFQLDGDCVTAEYKLRDVGNVAVRNTLYWLKNQTSHHMDGLALIAFPNAANLEGRLNVTFFENREKI